MRSGEEKGKQYSALSVHDSLTEFIEDEGIRLYPLTELVRFTADQDGHIEGLGH